MARLFISQDRIDQLQAEERIVVAGDRMEIPALGATFRIVPALHFLRVVTDEGDTHALVGRVKTETQLKTAGAEIVANSVLLGESAYECEIGFLGETAPGETAAPTKKNPE